MSFGNSPGGEGGSNLPGTSCVGLLAAANNVSKLKSLRFSLLPIEDFLRIKSLGPDRPDLASGIIKWD